MRSSPSDEAQRRARLAALIARPFAHRGLHGAGIPENSLAAFAAAIEAGRGIELDVRLSADGEAVVFHDAELGRLAEASGPVAARAAAELGRIRLRGSDETIPTLAETLALIAGRTGLLVEVKAAGRRADAISRATARALGGYTGPVAVMSFNPEVGRWFARNASERLRGLVVTEAGKGWRGPLERSFALWRSRPDFLAYDIRDLPSRFASRRRAQGLPVLTWTCRSEADQARAAAHADQIIYEAQQ